MELVGILIAVVIAIPAVSMWKKSQKAKKFDTLVGYLDKEPSTSNANLLIDGLGVDVKKFYEPTVMLPIKTIKVGKHYMFGGDIVQVVAYTDDDGYEIQHTDGTYEVTYSVDFRPLELPEFDSDKKYSGKRAGQSSYYMITDGVLRSECGNVKTPIVKVLEQGDDCCLVVTSQGDKLYIKSEHLQQLN